MSDQPQYPTYPDYQQQYQQPQAPQYPPPAPPQKGGIGKWIALGGCGCLFFLAVIAGATYFIYQTMIKEPLKAINQHVAAIRDGNVEGAYNDCSSGFKKETTLQQFQDFVAGYPFFKTSKEFASSKRETKEGITTMEGDIECADGSKHPVEYRLVKESGVFKVHYVHVKEAAPVVEKPREEPAPGGSEPEIFDVKVEKSQQGEMVTVLVSFQVENFQNSQSGGSYTLHLVQDLETLGPDGSKVNSLSQDAIKTLHESGGAEYTSANFSNTLSIPTSYPHGTYTVNLRVHDQIGGSTAAGSTTFEFP